MAKVQERDEDIPLDEDQIADFVTPRMSRQFFGHPEVCQFLEKGIASDALHHALLLHGPEGVGKATLAYHLGRHLTLPEFQQKSSLLSTPVNLETGEAHQFTNLSHPNFLTMQKKWIPDKSKFSSGIGVEQIRQLNQFAHLSAARDGKRVVIIDRAEDMNTSAANALLKHLEEPPPDLQFILVSSDTGALPATILSRCYKLRMRELEEEDLKSAVLGVLKASDTQIGDAAQLDELCSYARGSVRRVLVMFAGGGSQIRKKLIAILSDMPNYSHAQVNELIEQVVQKNNLNQLDILYSILLDWIADYLRHQLQSESKQTKPHQRVPEKRYLQQIANLWQQLVFDKRQALLLNLDQRVLLLNSFEQIAHTLRR